MLTFSVNFIFIVNKELRSCLTPFISFEYSLPVINHILMYRVYCAAHSSNQALNFLRRKLIENSLSTLRRNGKIQCGHDKNSVAFSGDFILYLISFMGNKDHHSDLISILYRVF